MNPKQPKAGEDGKVLLYMGGIDPGTGLCWICSNPRNHEFNSDLSMYR